VGAEVPLQRGDLLAYGRLTDALLAPHGREAAALDQPYEEAHRIQTVHEPPKHSTMEWMLCLCHAFRQWGALPKLDR
jgi:hypothetical protein